MESLQRGLKLGGEIALRGSHRLAPDDGIYAFQNGVAAGDVTDHSAVLWTRSVTSGSVRFEVSLDADFHEIIRTSTVNLLAGDTAHASFNNLRDGIEYYYRAVSADGDIATGQFTTAYDSGYHGLTFGVSGDWHTGNTPYAAISNADDANLDFFVQLGDTIYGDVPSPMFPGEQADSLDEFHIKYIETLTERGGANFLTDLRASTALWSMIDDHEITDDWAGGAPAGSDARFDVTGDYINESGMYATALQAFYDYQPIEQRTWLGTGEDLFDGTPDLYRTQAYGDDAQIFMVDARSFRDEELAAANIASPTDVTRFLTQSFDPSRTMLGDQQLARLEGDLLKAQENGVLWKFIMLPEPIQNLSPAAAADRYEGYAAERTALLKFIDDHDIQNVVFISADIHGTVVNNLTYQTSPFGPQIALDAWEITTGSVAVSTPFGGSVVNLARKAGLVSSSQLAFYNSLPVAPDSDSVVNDKDDFLKALIDQQLNRFGYDPLGLNHNLASANGLVDATLLQGDYVAAHTDGWTQFDIDPVTHELLVTTYGIASYNEATAAADPEAIAAREPVIVSQFRVAPDQTIEGRSAPDLLVGGNGDDVIIGGHGADVLTGSGGSDIFVFATGSGDDRITDFKSGTDRLDLRSLHVTMADIAVTSTDSGTLLSIDADHNGRADLTILLDNVGAPAISDYLLA